MDSGIRRIGPDPTSAPRAVDPTKGRRERQGGRDFGAELEQQGEGEDERPSPAPATDRTNTTEPDRPRVNPDDGTGTGLDVVA